MLLVLNLATAKKVALVIGNGDYNRGYLPNPTKDADLIAQKLEDVGFTVTPVNNIKTAPKMKEVINNFAKKLNKDDIAVVYYAGHGVQCLGKNYLMPTKANVARGGQLASEAVDLNFLIGGLEKIKLAIVMLDACRNNTYPSCSKSQTRGLVQPTVSNDGGMIVSFATAENDIALDGNGDHSPYALALSKFMNQSLPIETFFREVGGEVYGASGQRPMLKNSFYGRFSFGSKSRGGSDDGHDMRGIVKIDGLMYQNNHQFIKEYTWKKGGEYCQGLTLGNYGDWRLPTRAELNKISNISMYGRYDDGYDQWFKKNKHKRLKGTHGKERFVRKEFIENMLNYSVFWTSESIDSSLAWNVFFSYGYDSWFGKTYSNYALCVR